MKDAQKQVKPPIAQKIPKELEIHGDLRIDNYYWLNERENQEVIDYLEQENAYYDTMTSHTKKCDDGSNDERDDRSDDGSKKG